VEFILSKGGMLYTLDHGTLRSGLRHCILAKGFSFHGMAFTDFNNPFAVMCSHCSGRSISIPVIKFNQTDKL